MREHIDSCHKESEIRVAYLEQNTAHFGDVANNTVNSASVIPQDEKMGVRKIVRKILTTNMKLIRVLMKRE